MKKTCGQKDDEGIKRFLRSAEADRVLGDELESIHNKLTNFVNEKLASSKMVEDRAQCVQDLVQEIQLKAWIGFDPARAQHGFWPFLKQIAENCLADYFKQRRRRYRIAPQQSLDEPKAVRNSGDTQEMPSRADSLQDPRTQIDDQVINEIMLKEALEQLTPEQRESIVWKYRYGLPNSEIARLLGKKVGTINSRLSRGLDALKLLLERDYQVK